MEGKELDEISASETERTRASVPVPCPPGTVVEDEDHTIVDSVKRERLSSAPRQWLSLCEVAVDAAEESDVRDPHQAELEAVKRCPRGKAALFIASDDFCSCIAGCLDMASILIDEAEIVLGGGDPFYGTSSHSLNYDDRLLLMELSLSEALMELLPLAFAFGGTVVQDAEDLKGAIDGFDWDSTDNSRQLLRGCGDLLRSVSSLYASLCTLFDGAQSDLILEIEDAIRQTDLVEDAIRRAIELHDLGPQILELTDEFRRGMELGSEYYSMRKKLGPDKVPFEIEWELGEATQRVSSLIGMIEPLLDVEPEAFRTYLRRKTWHVSQE